MLKEISGNHRSTNYAKRYESTPSFLEGWQRAMSHQNVKVPQRQNAWFPACRNAEPFDRSRQNVERTRSVRRAWGNLSGFAPSGQIEALLSSDYTTRTFSGGTGAVRICRTLS